MVIEPIDTWVSNGQKWGGFFDRTREELLDLALNYTLLLVCGSFEFNSILGCVHVTPLYEPYETELRINQPASKTNA